MSDEPQGKQSTQAAGATGDTTTAAAETVVDKSAAAAEAVVETVAKDADTLIQEAQTHIKQFVDHNLPTLEAQGHDFAGSLGTKLKTWLADVEAYLAKNTSAAATK